MKDESRNDSTSCIKNYITVHITESVTLPNRESNTLPIRESCANVLHVLFSPVCCLKIILYVLFRGIVLLMPSIIRFWEAMHYSAVKDMVGQ